MCWPRLISRHSLLIFFSLKLSALYSSPGNFSSFKIQFKCSLLTNIFLSFGMFFTEHWSEGPLGIVYLVYLIHRTTTLASWIPWAIRSDITVQEVHWEVFLGLTPVEGKEANWKERDIELWRSQWRSLLTPQKILKLVWCFRVALSWDNEFRSLHLNVVQLFDAGGHEKKA